MTLCEGPQPRQIIHTDMNLRLTDRMTIDKFQPSGLNRGARSLGCTCRSKLESADLCAGDPRLDRL
jgi:hypothetical protein